MAIPRLMDCVSHGVGTAVPRAMVLALVALLTFCGTGRAATTFDGTPVVLKAGDVQARIVLSADHSSSGRQLGLVVNFDIAPGWHIYGAPLPDGEGLTPTSITFDSDLLAQQILHLPKPVPLRFEALNQTYPVYTGSFKAVGAIVLSQKIKPGDYSIPGTLNFQQCNDVMCKMPQTVHFELPIKIEPPATNAPNT